MINDVTDAFSEWLEKVIGTRHSLGSFIDRRWVEGPVGDLPFYAVVQNATPDDLKVLEEGQRSSEVIKLHTETDLIAVDEDNGVTGDTLPYQGKTWTVINVARRFIGNYHKALAIRTKVK